MSPEEAVERATRVLVEVVRGIVDNPDDVSVSTETANSETVLLISVASEDRGLVVGKGGRTIRSLRTVLKAISVSLEHPMRLEIHEEAD